MAQYTEGNITYTVTLETKNLLENSARAQQELKTLSNSGTKASKGIDDIEKSASNAGNSLGKFTTIAKAVSAALLSSKIFAYAESWNELEDRIKNTGLTATQTKATLDALMLTSDRNGRSINETSELYIRLSNSMKELGYSAQGTLSYIDTLSNLLTVDKVKSYEAEAAINALTKAQLKGKLSGLEMMTVFNNMPTVLKVLVRQIGGTEQSIRAMATNGQLSMKQFTDAMIAAQSETSALADNMRNNLSDGVTRIENNLKRYLGELNNSTGATKLLVDSLILMSQHIDVLVNGLGILAAIYAGKYITSLAAATKQSAEKVIANIQLAISEKQLANEELRALEIEGRRLTERRAQLVALKAETTSKFQLASINKQLNAMSVQRNALLEREAAAQARLNAATKLSTVAMNGLKGAMNLLGGPAGILLIAAGAFISFASSAQEARKSAIDLKDNIEDLTESFKKMNKEQREAKLQSLDNKLEEQANEIKKETTRINNALNSIKEIETTGFSFGGFSEDGIKNLNKKLVEYRGNLADMQQGYDKTKAQIESLNSLNNELSNSTNKVTESTKKLNDEFSKDTTDSITKNITKLSQELEIAELKQKGLTREAYIYQGVLSALGDESTKYQAGLKGLVTGTAEMTDLTDGQQAKLAPLITLLEKMYNVNAQGAPKVKTAAEKLKELKDSLKGLADPLEKENFSYNESAKVLKDSLTNKLISQKDYQSKLEQLETEHQLNLAKIRSDNVVSPQDQAVAQVDPVQALMNENARKLALIQEYENQKLLTEQQALALREAANYQFEQNRINAQWEIWRNQSDANEFLASSLEGLASSATSTISGLMSGTMNATEAMQNFANVILNEAIGSLVQMGLQYVKNAITSQSTSADATAAQVTEAAALTAAYTPAAMQASIASYGAAATSGAASYTSAMGIMKAAAIAGGREHGGSVASNSMYRVGEGGKPEILMAGGRQYMIPGENGRVLSNKDITSSGSQSLNLNVIINNAPEGMVVESATMNDREVIINMAVSRSEQKIASGISERTGQVWRSLTNTTNVIGKN